MSNKFERFVNFGAAIITILAFFFAITRWSEVVEFFTPGSNPGTSSPSSTVPPVAGTNVLSGSVSNSDSRGFLSSPARCDSQDTVIVIARSITSDRPGSKVVICKTNRGAIYYRGARDKPGDTGARVSNVYRSGDSYIAQTSDGHTYDINSTRLLISRRGTTLSNEQVVEFASRD